MNQKKKPDVITIGDLINSIMKNIYLAVIVTLLVTVLGGIYTFFVAEEKYKASSTMVVAITEDTNGEKLDFNNSLKLIYTIKELITQDIVIYDVAEKNNISPTELANGVKITSNDKSYLITVHVINTDKELAVELANDLVDEIIYEINNNEVFKFAKGAIKQTSTAKKAVYDSPNKPVFLLISFVLGAALSFGIIFIKEFASNKFKTRREIEYQFEDKVIGMFYDNPTMAKNEQKDAKTVELVEPTIRAFESYNKLLSNIKYSNLENPYKVIMFTSTAKNELKSSICSNLAYCMVNNNKKALVIDFDTRKPVLHKVFKVSKEKGLVDYLEGEINKEELIKHTESGVDVITVGKKVINPMVVIESTKVKELINELREEYDYILLDTPPMLAGADGLAVSKLADGVLFNIALDQARKSDIKDSINALNEVNANIIGINLTKIRLSKKDLQYYYYEE